LDGDDLLPVDPDSVEELLEQLSPWFGVGLVLPEAAEVFKHTAGAVEIGGGSRSERIRFGVEGEALGDVLGAVEVARVRRGRAAACGAR
jgi:hypothetical protein